MNSPDRDLAELLKAVDTEAASAATSASEERRALDQKIRHLDERLRQAKDARSQLDAEVPRAARRFAQRRVLAVQDRLARDFERLHDPARGAWGEPIVLPATLTDSGLRVVAPAPAAVATAWSDHRETAPLRIAIVAYGFLVRVAVEEGAPPIPALGSWSGFATLDLPLSVAGAARDDLVAEDAQLLLDESAPTPWAGGGCEQPPRLVWVPSAIWEEEGPVTAGLDAASHPHITSAGDAAITIEEAATRLGLHPFEVVRHTVEKRQATPGLTIEPAMVATIMGWAGIEDWWEEDAVAGDGPSGADDDSPRSDPDPKRRVVRWIPFKLLQKGKVGASHTRVDNAWRGLSGDLRGFGKDVVDLLKREGLLLSKPTVNGEHIFLDPTHLDVIESIIHWRDPPAAFRALAGDD